MIATCESCLATKVLLVARLVADPDQLVCGTCHDDPRIPTISLTEGPLSREDSRAVLMADMAPKITGPDTAAMAAFIADEFSQYGLTGITWADPEP
jgi:hypothetical protein